MLSRGSKKLVTNGCHDNARGQQMWSENYLANLGCTVWLKKCIHITCTFICNIGFSFRQTAVLRTPRPWEV